MLEQRIACRDCGTRPEEWDPKQGGDRDAYFPRTYSCQGCKKIFDAKEADTQNAKKSKNDHPHRPWVKVRLVPQLEVKAEQFRRRYVGTKREDEGESKPPPRRAKRGGDENE